MPGPMYIYRPPAMTSFYGVDQLTLDRLDPRELVLSRPPHPPSQDLFLRQRKPRQVLFEKTRPLLLEGPSIAVSAAMRRAELFLRFGSILDLEELENILRRERQKKNPVDEVSSPAQITSDSEYSTVPCSFKDRLSQARGYHWQGAALLPQDVLNYFEQIYPGETYRLRGCALLERGAAVLVSEQDPAHLVVVQGTGSIPDEFVMDDQSRIKQIKYGHPAHVEHMEASCLSSRNPDLRGRFSGYLKDLQSDTVSLSQLHAAGKLDGLFKVGFEWEFWVLYNPANQGLFRLGRIFRNEHVAGLVERNDMGEFCSPAHAAVSHAQTFLREANNHYPDIIISTSTPLCGTPEDVDLNIFDDKSPFARFVAMVNDMIPHYGPLTEYSRVVRAYQAQHHGYSDTVSMINALGLRLSTQAATHLNFGVQNVPVPSQRRYETEQSYYQNLSNLVNSELFGSVLRMLMFSSPYITEVAPKVRGDFVRDIREIIKQDTGTSRDPNEMIESAEHWQDVVVSSLTTPRSVFTLDRASIGITRGRDIDGHVMMEPQVHSQSRWRIKDTGLPSLRLELTGGGATAILPKIRAMAILQLIGMVALVATVRQQDARDMVAEKLAITRKDVEGNLYRGVMHYNFHGPKSKRTATTVARLKKIFLEIYQAYQINVFTENMRIALPALDSLMEEGNLWDFANGKGTLGGALLSLARQGYSGSEAARQVFQLQNHEARTIRRWATRHGKRTYLDMYLEGKIGLPYHIGVFE